MTLMTELISLDRNSKIPLYLQLANGLTTAIRRGHLRRGLKLPGTREMADLFGIQRNTAVAAYEELLAQGWLKMLPRKGTFVAEQLPVIKPSPIKKEESGITGRYPAKSRFPFTSETFFEIPPDDPNPSHLLVINDGFPDLRLAPVEELMREIRSLIRQPAFRKYYTYGSPMGPLPLREALATFLSDTRGLPVSSDEMLITKGAQMGLYLAANLLLKPGEGAVVGEPGYFAATQIFRQTGAVLHYVPVDEDGIDVNRIGELCKTQKIRLVYVIPHHHNPTTVTLTPERRMHLLQLADQYKFAIIEDDYDYDFHYTGRPILPLASLDDNGNVIYVGSLTKTLVPAVRVGFMIAPPDFIRAAASLRRSIDFQGDMLTEMAIAEMYRNGAIDRHIRKVVKVAHHRRDHFCDLLRRMSGEHVLFNVPDGGMSVWARFQGVDLKQVAVRAKKMGLVIYDGTIYNRIINYNSCRLGFASLNEKEQQNAVEILAEAIFI